MRSVYFGRQNSWDPIQKCETQTSIKKGSASPSIKSTQFPLTLAKAFTVQKVQGFYLGQFVINSNLPKQNSFGSDQIHSKVKNMIIFVLFEKCKKSRIKVKKDALLEYECLKQNDYFPE